MNFMGKRGFLKVGKRQVGKGQIGKRQVGKTVEDAELALCQFANLPACKLAPCLFAYLPFHTKPHPNPILRSQRHQCLRLNDLPGCQFKIVGANHCR